MYFSRLNRKELQTLCKLHGLPANKTNVFMAEALSARLNDGVQKMESAPYPSEAGSEVKLKVQSNRILRSKKVADVSEAKDLWFVFTEDWLSRLADRTPAPGCKDVLAAGKDVHKAVVGVKVESDVVAEPAKLPGWEQTMESMPDPTEVAKSIARATPSVRSEKGAADALEAREAVDLSSEFEKCTTLAADSEYVMAKQTGEDTPEAVTEMTIEVPHELPRDSDVGAEPAESSSLASSSVDGAGHLSTPAKVVTQVLKESPEADSDSWDFSSLVDAAPVFFTPVWSPGRWSTPAKAPTKSLTESAKACHCESFNSWRDDAPMFFTPSWSPGRCRTPSPAKVLKEAFTKSARSNFESPSSPGDGALVFFTPICSSRSRLKNINCFPQLGCETPV